MCRPLLHLVDRGEPLADVSVSVRAECVSGASDYGVGLVCRYENAASYYLLALLSGGRYNIVRYRKGRGRSLTSGIQQGPAPAEGPTALYAKCTGDDPASLTLSVDGRPLATFATPRRSGAAPSASGWDRASPSSRSGSRTPSCASCSEAGADSARFRRCCTPTAAVHSFA